VSDILDGEHANELSVTGSWLWEDTSLRLQQLNLVAYPDLAAFDYPRADTTATL
jgi:hypothetical protein